MNKYRIPDFIIDEALKSALENIEEVVDNLNEKRDKGLDKNLEDKIKNHLLISRVFNSNAIEGSKLSLRETQIILEHGLAAVNERPLKDELEAATLAKASDFLYSLINGKEPLNKKSLLEIHQIIMDGIDDKSKGQFRKTSVKIKNSKHTPPEALLVDELIDEMFKWMNRQMHKFPPIVMGAILHHWLVWIHPFSDGNGRVGRLFLDFFLLQKGYPELVIRISDRDDYYDGLIEADNGNITKLVHLFVEKIRQVVSLYEEFINEHDREQDWKEKYIKLSEQQSNYDEKNNLESYENIKKKYSYGYEVWTKQIDTFKSLLKESLNFVGSQFNELEFSLREYDIISFSQYLDLLENRSVTNTWYILLNIFDKRQTGKKISFVFYFGRLKVKSPIQILGQKEDKDGNILKRTNNYIKLCISSKPENIIKEIDLVNIGTNKDRLSFGIVNKKRKKRQRRDGSYVTPDIITVSDYPSRVVRNFIDQVLRNNFNIKV